MDPDRIDLNFQELCRLNFYSELNFVQTLEGRNQVYLNWPRVVEVEK